MTDRTYNLPPDNPTELTEHDWVQIEQAAGGCISGRLEEWPHLIVALRKLGKFLDPETACNPRVRELCKLLVAKHGRD